MHDAITIHPDTVSWIKAAGPDISRVLTGVVETLHHISKSLGIAKFDLSQDRIVMEQLIRRRFWFLG